MGETDDVIMNGELATCHTLTSPAPDLMLKKKNTTWLRYGNRLGLWVLYVSLSVQHQLSGFMTETECVYCAVRTGYLYI